MRKVVVSEQGGILQRNAAPPSPPSPQASGAGEVPHCVGPGECCGQVQEESKVAGRVR